MTKIQIIASIFGRFNTPWTFAPKSPLPWLDEKASENGARYSTIALAQKLPWIFTLFIKVG